MRHVLCHNCRGVRSFHDFFLNRVICGISYLVSSHSVMEAYISCEQTLQIVDDRFSLIGRVKHSHNMFSADEAVDQKNSCAREPKQSPGVAAPSTF
jgi:hypothetical protein